MGVLIICVFFVLTFVILSLLITHTLIDDLNSNDKIYLFFNGIIPKMNRKATINKITEDKIYIYDILPLPLDYKGRFYGVGVAPDGVKLIYVKAYVFIYFAKIAELLRRKKDVRTKGKYRIQKTN